MLECRLSKPQRIHWQCSYETTAATLSLAHPPAVHYAPQEWLHGLGIDLPMSGMPIGAVIVLIALPGFAIKQVTNVEQLRDSAVLLLSLDAPVEGSVKRAPKLA